MAIIKAGENPIELLMISEPSPDSDSHIALKQQQRLQVRYPEGPMDCEAVWFDSRSQQIMLLGKRGFPFVRLYRVPIDEFGSTDVSAPCEAELALRLALPASTGADFDEATGDVWITSYWQAWRYSGLVTSDSDDRSANLIEQMTAEPIMYQVPKWKQIEAVAVDADARVWISTEGHPAAIGCLTKREFVIPDTDAR